MKVMIVILSDFVISKLYIYILINSLQSIDSLKKKKKNRKNSFHYGLKMSGIERKKNLFL